jgi:pyrroline-5-carboxylate reductase
MKKSERIAIIGTGAMGSAFIHGLINASILPPADIIGSDADNARLQALSQELGITSATSNVEAVQQAAIVMLFVKPGLVDSVLAEIAPSLHAGQLLISIAAGVPLSRLRAKVDPAKIGLVRVMPNTPALVGAGMSAVAFAPEVQLEVRKRVLALFRAVGEVVEVEEKLMDAVTGLSGSGPAYVFVLIEALADGGVAAGLPRVIAQQLAIQTVLGSALLLKQTGQHPGAAKDSVASPGGTTIAGLAELEKGGFRACLLRAVTRAAERARELSG